MMANQLKWILLIVCVYSCQTIYGQERFVISGKTVDKDFNTPVPNIHVYTKNFEMGTVSRANGNFNMAIPSTLENSYIYFSSIGYETDSLLIQNYNEPVNIMLVPELYSLSEIYVMPDSTLLTLFRKAYNRIPDNYPDQPVLYEGFFQEYSNDGNDKDIYHLEAILSIYKEPYKKKNTFPGQVQILRSRKKHFKNQTILWAAGPFHAVYDWINTRTSFLDPKHFKDFDYEFNGIKTAGNLSYYDISYKNEKMQGRIWIEKETLAYIFLEKEERDRTDLRVKFEFVQHKKTFKKKNDRWHLDKSEYTALVKDNITNSYNTLFINYQTLSINTDSVQPIAYKEQLGYNDPIILKSDEHQTEFWGKADTYKEHASFLQETEEAYTTKVQKKEQTSKFLFDVLLKLNFDLGIAYRPVSLKEFNGSVHFQPAEGVAPFTTQYAQETSREVPFIQYGIGYRINKHFNFFWRANGDYFNSKINSSENYIGLEYRQPLTKRGRPVYFEPSVSLNLANYYVSIDTYDNPTTFSYRNKTFDSKNVTLEYGKQQKSITPQIALSVATSKSANMKLYFSYDISLKNKNVFRLKENSGFLWNRKKVIVSPDDIIMAEKESLWSGLEIMKAQIGLVFTYK